MAQQLDPDIEAKRAEAAKMAWGESPSATSRPAAAAEPALKVCRVCGSFLASGARLISHTTIPGRLMCLVTITERIIRVRIHVVFTLVFSSN